MSQLDETGLIGAHEGKRSLSFEFCIPNQKSARQTILEIDSSIQFSRSPGRIGCLNNEIICLGETKEDFKLVLRQFAALEMIESIEQTFFE